MWSSVTSFFHLTFIYKFLCGHVFNSPEHMPRSRLAGSLDNQIVFHNSYIVLQYSIRDPCSPALVIVCILSIAILVCVKCFFIVVLTRISLMADDVIFFMYLLATWIAFLGNVYSNPVPIFELVCLFIVEL